MSTALLSQGATIWWGADSPPGDNAKITNVTRVTLNGGGDNGPEISVAHLGSCHCKEEPYIPTWGPSGSGKTLQVDFMGESPFTVNDIKNFKVATPSNASLIYYVDCTCVSVQSSAQVGDVIRGSATIRYS